MKEFDPKLIAKRKDKLDVAKSNLKSYFVGLDNIIDRVFSLIEVWYVMPELLTKPMIIACIGMTGSGKTSLVRKIVTELSYEDSYAEVQLKTKTLSSNSDDTIQKHLINSGITSKKPSILLLDEIQRFKTKDDEGKSIENHAYYDIWELLSDGSFSDATQEARTLYRMMMDVLWDIDVSAHRVDSDTKSSEKSSERIYKNYVWDAENLKRMLELEEPLDEIMTWDNNKKVSLIKSRLKEVIETKERKTFNNMLIFVCGNLDEAYNMADESSETNIDADIFHEHSKHITVVDIKKALKKRFKPEQIARLGNNYVIYPSLRRKDFEGLIDKCLNDISNKSMDITGIKIEFDDSTKKAIYRNGVYPVQGVRPVFSTINAMIENSIPHFLYKCLMNHKHNIFIKSNDSLLVAEMYNDKSDVITERKKITLDIDQIVNNIDYNTIVNNAVHEAGHAVAYSLLFKIAPPQIICDSTDDGGFVMPHGIRQDKSIMLDVVKIYMAGLAAEEIVFGTDNRSTGSWHDIDTATADISTYIRTYSMDSIIGRVLCESHPSASSYLTNIGDTNERVSQIIQDQKDKIQNILQKNHLFLDEVTKLLLKNRRVKADEFYEIAKDYVKDLKVVDNSHIIIGEYESLLDNYLTRKKD